MFKTATTTQHKHKSTHAHARAHALALVVPGPGRLTFVGVETSVPVLLRSPKAAEAVSSHVDATVYRLGRKKEVAFR